MSKSGICLMNIKIYQRHPSKKKQRAHLNILETGDSHMEPDEIMLKFKHTKIEPN